MTSKVVLQKRQVYLLCLYFFFCSMDESKFVDTDTDTLTSTSEITESTNESPKAVFSQRRAHYMYPFSVCLFEWGILTCSHKLINLSGTALNIHFIPTGVLSSL